MPNNSHNVVSCDSISKSNYCFTSNNFLQKKMDIMFGGLSWKMGQIYWIFLFKF